MIKNPNLKLKFDWKMNFDRLPELAQIRVFSLLNVKERLLMKRTSKNVKMLIEHYFPLNSLCIFESGKPAYIKWPFSEETIKDQEKVRANFQISSTKRRFDLDLSMACFRNLKRLHFEGDLIIRNDALVRELLGQISYLEELEVLSIHSVRCLNLNSSKLKKLKVVSLDKAFVCFERDAHVGNVEAPDLREFNICDHYMDREIKLSVDSIIQRPEKLAVLRCGKFDETYPINLLTGLKHLVCQDVDRSFSLGKLPSLKLLETFPATSETIDILKNETKHFGQNVKVFVFGFGLEKLPAAFAKIDEFAILKKYHCALGFDFLQKIALNYFELERPCCMPAILSYSCLIRSFDSQVPRDFFRFYPSIETVVVCHKTEHSSLIRFLCYGTIKTLELRDDCFEQEFFNELSSLSTVVSSLLSLFFRRYTTKIDFSFVSKLENLARLTFASKSRRIWPSLSGLGCGLRRCKHFKGLAFIVNRRVFASMYPSCGQSNTYYSSVKHKNVYKGDCIQKATDCILSRL